MRNRSAVKVDLNVMVRVKVGDCAPDFTLPSSAGGNVTLSEFFGRESVVLFFYPMDESPVCAREALAFKANYQAFKEIGAEVIGVSSQDVESHRAFASHQNLPFILLSDADNRVRDLYGVPKTLGVVPGRVTFVIDKEGLVKCAFSSQFQPARHAKEALRALKAEQKNIE